MLRGTAEILLLHAEMQTVSKSKQPLVFRVIIVK